MLVLYKSVARMCTHSVIFVVNLLLFFNYHENGKSCRRIMLDIKYASFFSITIVQSIFHLINI
jgi:multisubunit Na+/H+ antiporter MnhE subunit